MLRFLHSFFDIFFLFLLMLLYLLDSEESNGCLNLIMMCIYFLSVITFWNSKNALVYLTIFSGRRVALIITFGRGEGEGSKVKIINGFYKFRGKNIIKEGGQEFLSKTSLR